MNWVCHMILFACFYRRRWKETARRHRVNFSAELRNLVPVCGIYVFVVHMFVLSFLEKLFLEKLFGIFFSFLSFKGLGYFQIKSSLCLSRGVSL